jgi:hypothetical protein
VGGGWVARREQSHVAVANQEFGKKPGDFFAFEYQRINIIDGQHGRRASLVTFRGAFAVDA